MALTITASTGTTAFAELGVGEVIRILDRIKRAIDEGRRRGEIRDGNGLSVGQWSLTLDT